MLGLYNNEAVARKAVKDARSALDLATLRKYGDLTTPEIKVLVLDDKWHATVAEQIASEFAALTQGLVARIQELGERYAQTADLLDSEVKTLTIKVADHLAEMGFK